MRANTHRIAVTYTGNGKKELATSLLFTVRPRAGDGVETAEGGYIVRRVIHARADAKAGEPRVELLLEPTETFS